jgi:hypothetical protein
MYVVKPVDADGELRPFLSPKAANEWAQTGAYQECGADICEIYTVDASPICLDLIYNRHRITLESG